MKLRKRLAVLSAAALMTVSLAAPASAHGHGGHGYSEQSCGVIAAATVLGETAQSVLEQVQTAKTCVRALVEQAGKLQEYREECRRLREERIAAGLCAGENHGHGNGDCNGQGYGSGECYGNGDCDGAGANCGSGTPAAAGSHHNGDHHGSGHHGGHH